MSGDLHYTFVRDSRAATFPIKAYDFDYLASPEGEGFPPSLMGTLKSAIVSCIPEVIVDLNLTVPEPVALIVHRMLAKDPSERPSAVDLVRLLDESRDAKL